MAGIGFDVQTLVIAYLVLVKRCGSAGPKLGTPQGVVLAVASLVFGLAHWYQGRRGALVTGALGAVWAGWFWPQVRSTRPGWTRLP